MLKRLQVWNRLRGWLRFTGELYGTEGMKEHGLENTLTEVCPPPPGPRPRPRPPQPPLLCNPSPTPQQNAFCLEWSGGIMLRLRCRCIDKKEIRHPQQEATTIVY